MLPVFVGCSGGGGGKARVVWELMRKKSLEAEQDRHRSILMVTEASIQEGPSEEDPYRLEEVNRYSRVKEVGGEDGEGGLTLFLTHTQC